MSAHRVSARALWEREVRAGLNGQDRQRSGTWTCDALWRAACWEAAAAESRADAMAAAQRGDTSLHAVHLQAAENKQARADLALVSLLAPEASAA